MSNLTFLDGLGILIFALIVIVVLAYIVAAIEVHHEQKQYFKDGHYRPKKLP